MSARIDRQNPRKPLITPRGADWMNSKCSSLRPMCTFFRKSVSSLSPGLLHPAVYYISSLGIRNLTKRWVRKCRKRKMRNTNSHFKKTKRLPGLIFLFARSLGKLFESNGSFLCGRPVNSLPHMGMPRIKLLHMGEEIKSLDTVFMKRSCNSQFHVCWSPGTHRKVWGGNWAFLGGKPAWCFLTWEAQSTPSLQGSRLAPGTRSPCASWRTQWLSDGPLWSLCTTDSEAENSHVVFLTDFTGWAQGGNIYLEAVKDGNVDLHQCLVLPEGGSLSGVQTHLVCNLLQVNQKMLNVTSMPFPCLFGSKLKGFFLLYFPLYDG